MIKNNSINYDILYLIFVFLIGSTLFTSLRFTNIPIGIGELILLVLGIYMIINNYKELNYNFFKNSLLLKFWIVSFVLLLAGFLISFFLENILFYKSIFHDTFAYIFIFYLLIIMHLFEYDKKKHMEIFEKFIYFSLIFYTILFISFVSFESVIPFNKGSEVMVRYLGLSNNPNQLAILFTIIPFMLVYFYQKMPKIYFLDSTFLLILLTFCIGEAIGSDALFLGWCSGLFTYLFLIYISKYNNFKINIFFVVIISIIFTVVLFNFKEIIYFIDGGDSSADARIILIKNAFNDLDKMIYFGFGPGPHSYAPIDETMYWEVHNMYIDWFTQTGIIGILLFIYILYKVVQGLYLNKEFILISAFVSLLIFITFHFTFRQPIFWFFMFFFYIMSQGDKKCVE